jgi:flagellar biosynthesis anti-sigma factor FlgM
MTSSIGSLPTGRDANEALGQPNAPGNPSTTSAAASGRPVEPVPAPDPVTAATGGSQASEAVTLSAGAQATAQLLGAARAADGVDTAKVAQLRQAVQAGSYDVKPADVAKAILGAFGGAVTGTSA